MSVENQVNTIGTAIANLRKERKLTQAALARQAGISASAIAMYETDRRTPDRVAIKKLAAALHVRMNVLLAVLEPGTNPVAPVDFEPLEEPAAESDAPAAAPATAVETLPQTPVVATPAPQPAANEDSEKPNLTQLALTREEARIILFLRMNPQAMSFFQSYIAAGGRRREQLERAWRLIHEFQPVPEQGS